MKYYKHDTKLGSFYEAEDGSENIQAYGKDNRLAKLMADVERGIHTVESYSTSKIKTDDDKRKAVGIDLAWADKELSNLRDKIEDAEDTGAKVPKLRSYRQALKQYKSDIYMPNVRRPVL